MSRPASLIVPIARRESSFSKNEIERYEAGMLASLIIEINRLARPFDFYDCGADIGIVSLWLIRRTTLLMHVYAVEPNAEAFQYLEKSAKNWPVEANVFNKALSDFIGRGRLVSPATDQSAHAKFLEQDVAGDIDVVRLDDIAEQSGRVVVLKIDVEGGEAALIDGAMKTLGAAPAFVIVFEAHPHVYQRGGSDPCEIIKKIEAIAPIKFLVAEKPEFEIDLNKSFFSQWPTTKESNCNIVCASKTVGETHR